MEHQYNKRSQTPHIPTYQTEMYDHSPPNMDLEGTEKTYLIHDEDINNQGLLIGQNIRPDNPMDKPNPETSYGSWIPSFGRRQ